ncbi:glycosyl hydrolase [Paenibacillus glycanilyticus]|uniref:Glycosyl hydrolases family 2 sugar binding domain-containing protein n=1 Tax=Paenibacillus glycanilyticus TaxID=126569 RepID=A0ABQ6GGK0_9BACL|nr:glycosyl hydrolase [Paenibacillus glycanilyticus]GLX68441.1 hypothetical protein MU1_27860 [Paenibacillus glycanilyticus]
MHSGEEVSVQEVESKVGKLKSNGYSIGFPSRDPDLDVYPGFVQPPQGYGEVAFYWWVGDSLTKERLEWQLEQLKDHHVTALQINYAHTDQGGDSFGLSIVSDPPLFSEEWWELFAWFAEKAGTYGIAVSLSDYTLCSPGQGWYADEILAKKPSLAGSILKYEVWDAEAGHAEQVLPSQTLSVSAFRTDTEGKDHGEWLELLSHVEGSSLRWQPPAGSWKVIAVYSETVSRSIDPMHPESGAMVIEHFFQRFEDRLSCVPSARLGFFFSDELEFGVKGQLWNDRFRSEFRQRKGYDIVPELAALFMDIGLRTSKIRLDYGDVMVAVSEEHYFIPVFNWHQERGMIYGCDHGGRGRDITEFGDYFRTQRWNQGPGCDQPGFQSDLIKNKVASSISHLYERPRTWLEGFYGTGWGTNTASVTDAVFRNFVSGHNLLTLHGLYYTTYGGWWEWAPPCNHFRMPYWEHMKSLLACTERLSYLLSQGVHACDVAVVYPVASMEAGIDGHASVQSAFGIGEYLYKRGIDFDFMDFESLDRAIVENRELRVAGEAYRVLVLPSMRVLRYSTLQKAHDFHKAGGIVIALDRLPEASDRLGAADPVLDEIVQAVFGWSAADAAAAAEAHVGRTNRNAAGGLAVTAYSFEEAADLISSAFPRDFACMGDITDSDFPYVMHRRIGNRHVYAVYGGPEHEECFFRCHGSIELWNPWDGSAESIKAARTSPEGTFLRLPPGRKQMQLVVFSPVRAERNAHDDLLPERRVIEAEQMELNGEWEFVLQPTMDNRFGDFRQPPDHTIIGAEARQFRYALEEEGTVQCWSDPGLDDSSWKRVTCGYGPYFWKLGPIPDSCCSDKLEAELRAMTSAPERQFVTVQSGHYNWELYEFSMRYGMEGDPGHQGYHGLKGEMSDDFLAVGNRRFTQTDTQYEAEEEGEGEATYFWSTFDAYEDTAVKMRIGGNRPVTIWLNGNPINGDEGVVTVEKGVNRILLKYDLPGRGHVVFERTTAPEDWKQPIPLAMSWYNKPGVIPYQAYPGNRSPVAGWYRFTAPPGLHEMNITAHGDISVWVDGEEYAAEQQHSLDDGARAYTVRIAPHRKGTSSIAVRISYDISAYAGAALPVPIKLQCGEGTIQLGDWSAIDGLTCYSGGAVYRKEVEWTREDDPHAYQVKLDLGAVSATAEIRVNGQNVQTLLAPPWHADIAKWLGKGSNLIEVKVYNTLANHYVTIPTRYRGDLISGLLGPVRLHISNK